MKELTSKEIEKAFLKGLKQKPLVVEKALREISLMVTPRLADYPRREQH